MNRRQRGGTLDVEHQAKMARQLETFGSLTLTYVVHQINSINYRTGFYASNLAGYGLDFDRVMPEILACVIEYLQNYNEYYNSLVTYNITRADLGFDDSIHAYYNPENEEQQAFLRQCSATLATLATPEYKTDISGHIDFMVKCAWSPYWTHSLLQTLLDTVKQFMLEHYGNPSLTIKDNDGVEITLDRDLYNDGLFGGQRNLLRRMGFEEDLQRAISRGIRDAVTKIPSTVVEGPAPGGSSVTYPSEETVEFAGEYAAGYTGGTRRRRSVTVKKLKRARRTSRRVRRQNK